MKKNQKLKIHLKSGNTAADVLTFLKTTESTDICFIVDRDFLLITELVFLKRLRQAVLKSKKNIIFVTPKTYFHQCLNKHKFTVQGYEPEEYEGVEGQSLSHFFGKIEAQKNVFEAKKIDAKPKVQNTSKPQFLTRKIENLTQEKSLRGVYFFVLLIIIGGLGSVFFVISPQAEIVIKPRISTSEVTQNIVVGLPDAQFASSDKNLPKIQGIRVETEVSDTQTFPSTGRTYELTNARGKVTIFNETEEPKYLLPSRLASEDGVILQMQGDVTVPPRVEGKPGEATVEVIAFEYDADEKPIGSRGNIDAGTELYFPALRKETRELYYAKANQGPLVGGSTLTNYFVGETDAELAQPILEDSFRIRATENLKEELAKRSDREDKAYILLEQGELLTSELLSYEYDDTQTGQPLQAFEVKGALKMSGLVFDQSAIVKILSEKIKENQDHRKKIIEIDQNTVEYRVLETEDFVEKGWVKLSVTMGGVETLDFEAQNQFARDWQQLLKKEILGKSASEARGMLVNHPEIESVVKMTITPFWVNNLPHLTDQIKLDVVY